MYYTYVKILNFKGIKDLRIDFERPPRNNVITLVGLNESGKTTILEALNYFSYGSEDLDPSELTGYTLPDIHDLVPISKRANFNDSISIEFGVETEDDDDRELRDILRIEGGLTVDSSSKKFCIKETYPFKNSKHTAADRTRTWTYNLTGTTGRQRKPRRYGANSDQWHVAINFLKERLPRIIYFPNFLFDFPEQICIEKPGIDDAARDPKDEFYTAVLQDVLDALDSGASIEDHLLARFHSDDDNDQKSLHALLLDMGRHITNSVFNEWNSIFGTANLRKKVSLSIGDNDEKLACMRFEIEDSDGLFDIKERSLGFRWFFVYLLLTHYRGFRKVGGDDLLFLFDEPASNLHSTAQQQLLKSFAKLSQRCRVIYATHSHHLINPDWLESAYVVRNTGLEYDSDRGPYDFNANNTDIQATRYRSFAVNHPNQSTYFQPVLDVLDYRPSRLEAVPAVVMLEGKNDFYALKLAGLNNINPCLPLMPGTGAGSLDTVIQLYIAWGRQFVVILDSDDEGTHQRKRYQKAFGSLVKDRLFLLSDVNKEWKGLEMEDLYEDTDKHRIQITVYPGETKYSKDHFNRAVQEFVANKRPVTLSSRSVDRFSQLLQFLKDKLEVREV